jgi:hypothetical protein
MGAEIAQLGFVVDCNARCQNFGSPQGCAEALRCSRFVIFRVSSAHPQHYNKSIARTIRDCARMMSHSGRCGTVYRGCSTGGLRLIKPPSPPELPPSLDPSLFTPVPGPSPPPRFRGSRPKKTSKSIEHPCACIGTEEFAREARQRSVQSAGNAPRPPRAPSGAPGRRFINTRAFINRRSLVHPPIVIRNP